MNILLIADGRSPITQRWVQGVLGLGHTVRLVSTFPCPPLPWSEPGSPDLASISILPVAFSRLATGQQASAREVGQSSALRRLVRRFRPLFLVGRYYLGPLSLLASVTNLRREVENTPPDLIHALRIPFEGMLASYAPAEIPLFVSIWGNDLTLHARGSPLMGALTRRALQRSAGLLPDAQRDARLARKWGYPEGRPVLVVPGSGGIHLDEIHTGRSEVADLLGETLKEDCPLVVNPRGFRPGSVRNDTFFRSIPLILQRVPEAVFACPAMKGEAEAMNWIEKLGVASQVRLLPTLPQARLWDLFQQTQVLVSPSTHDGIPNSLLEGMACGCFPVAGDIESLREWITSGENGLLVNPADPHALAEAVCQALRNPSLRSQAARLNARLIVERADVKRVMPQVDLFYREVMHVN